MFRLFFVVFVYLLVSSMKIFFSHFEINSIQFFGFFTIMNLFYCFSLHAIQSYNFPIKDLYVFFCYFRKKCLEFTIDWTSKFTSKKIERNCSVGSTWMYRFEICWIVECGFLGANKIQRYLRNINMVEQFPKNKMRILYGYYHHIQYMLCRM